MIKVNFHYELSIRVKKILKKFGTSELDYITACFMRRIKKLNMEKYYREQFKIKYVMPLPQDNFKDDVYDFKMRLFL